MNATTDLQRTFDIIGKLQKTSRKKRVALFRQQPPEIATIQWKIEDENAVVDYILGIAHSIDLSPNEKKEIKSLIKDNIKEVNTVAALEDKLIKVRDDINLEIFNNIVNEINDYQPKIENAAKKLQTKINELEDLSKVLGTIAVGVSLFTALASASYGNFNGLIQIIDNLI